MEKFIQMNKNTKYQKECLAALEVWGWVETDPF
jgi:hypothetical protein